jgi:hypothetical protein
MPINISDYLLQFAIYLMDIILNIHLKVKGR